METPSEIHSSLSLPFFLSFFLAGSLTSRAGRIPRPGVHVKGEFHATGGTSRGAD
eukprot:COSAG02_NODE_35937_length_461_cov_0.784530_1_plen_54_part_10